MTRDQYREQWLKWDRKYLAFSIRVVKSALKQSFGSLPIDDITYDNYRIVVPLNVHVEPILKAYVDIYTTIGLLHGKRIGLGINREIKRFDNDLFSHRFQERMLDWVNDNCGQRITSVNKTTALKIQRLDEMHKYIFKQINLPIFTKYQASRIARTETTSAANYAAHQAALESEIDLEKIWISQHDNRTRDGYPEHWDHLGMDGVSIPLENDFHFTSTTGQKNDIQYPGDINTIAGNGINCRCTVAYRPKRDENGFIITR
jgi:hypothetical protein